MKKKYKLHTDSTKFTKEKPATNNITLKGVRKCDFQICQITLLKCLFFNKNYEARKEIGNADPYTNTNTRDKTRLCTLTISVQHNTRIFSQSM